jgi:hypothetical protein
MGEQGNQEKLEELRETQGNSEAVPMKIEH